jgi:acyl carrier protein
LSTLDAVVESAREAAARPLPPVTAETQLEDLELSSVEAMDMVAAIEERFAITLDPARLVGLETVGELVAVVDSVTGGSTTAAAGR